MTYTDPRYVREQTCASCLKTLSIQSFRGGRFKVATCKSCEESRPDLHWCVSCAAWLPVGDFYVVGVKRKHQSNLCKPCLTHRNHGVTRAHMRELTGFTVPQCSACGGSDRLSIDHDHAHCVGERGCVLCVRGYLCGPCNTAEGLLKTIERVRALADYMERSRLSEEILALPGPGFRTTSSTRERVRKPTRESKPRTYYVHR